MTEAAVRALVRRSFSTFVMKTFETLHPGAPPLNLSWYLEAMTHRLEQTRVGDEKRLVITVPPQHLKSITAAVAFPAWLLGHDPTTRVMVASYSHDLARKHAEQFRTIMDSSWYRAAFPDTRISDRVDRQLELMTTVGGGRRAVSVGGTTTGFPADYIIVDDCMKAGDANSQAMREELVSWFDGSLATRLSSKAAGRIISIQQRLHEADLPAHLLDKGYPHLNLPAIADRPERIALDTCRTHLREVGDLLDPLRESQATLDQLRRDLGPQVFSAQYQQNPTTPEGNLIHLDWFGVYEGSVERSYCHKVLQSWDTAMTSAPTSDWSVCTTWGYREGDWFLLDVFRQRLDYPDLKRAVLRLHHQWQPDLVIVEDANAGKSLVQELRSYGHTWAKLRKPLGDKETRLIGQTGQLEAGNFYLPEEAPWLDAFCSELRAFPMGRHDDQVDSMTQFLEFQSSCWRWAEQERLPNGRLARNVRARSRRAA